MYKLFDSVTQQDLAAVIQLKVILDYDYTLSELDANAQFFLNSNRQTTDFTAVAGDELMVQFTSANQYSYPVFIYFQVNGEWSVVGATTKDDPTLKFNPYYTSKSYLDQLTAPNGLPVTFTPEHNEYSVFNYDGSLLTNISLNSPPSGEIATNFTYLLETRNPYIYKIDLDRLEITAKIPTSAPCLGIAISEIPESNHKRCVWLTLENGEVWCLDQTDTLINTFRLNGNGLGIDVSSDGKMVAIADATANQIAVIEKVGAIWEQQYLPFGSLPYDVYIDYAKNIWITSKYGTKAYIYNYGNLVPVGLELGKGQKTIKQYDMATLAVVCTEIDELVFIDLLTRTVTKRIVIKPSPVDFCVVDTTIYVATAANTIVRVNPDQTVETVTSCTPALYAIESDVDRQRFYVISLYSNTPTLLYPPDRTTDNLKLDSPLGIYQHEVFNSDSVVIDDIDGQVYCGIPTIFSAQLFLNEHLVPNITPLVNHDSFRFRLTAEGYVDEPIIFPVFVGNNLSYFVTTVKANQDKIQPFYLDDILGADLNTSYDSNTFVVAGLVDDMGQTFTATQGQIILNGEVQTENSVAVHNGDTLALRLTSLADYGATISTVVTLSYYTEVWSINNCVDPTDMVIKPEFLHTPWLETKWDLGQRELLSVYASGILEARINLAEPPSLELATNTLYLANYTLNKVYAVDLGLNRLSHVVSLDGPFAVVKQGDRVVVACPKLNRLYWYPLTLDQAQVSFVELPTPYGMAVSGNKLYIAGGTSGNIYELEYRELVSRYELTATTYVGGFCYTVVYSEAQQALFCTDIANSKIKVVQFQTHTTTFEVGTNPYSLAILDEQLYCANTYDNLITVIDLNTLEQTTLSLPYPVHSIADGLVPAFINLENFDVAALTVDQSVLTLVDTGLQNSAIYSVADKYYVAHFHDRLFNSLVLRNTATSDDFIEQLALDLEVLVSSNEIIMHLARTLVLRAEGFPTISIVKNGEVYGDTVTVQEGDRISLQIMTPSQPDLAFNIRVIAEGYTKVWKIKTKQQSVPRMIKFNAVYDALTSSNVLTEERMIEGLSLDSISYMYAEDPSLDVYVNGELQSSYTKINSAIAIKNGDLIKLGWRVEMLYSTVKSHYLLSDNEVFGVFNVYAEDLIGPSSYSPFVNFSQLRNPQQISCQLLPTKQEKADMQYRPESGRTVSLHMTGSVLSQQSLTQDLIGSFAPLNGHIGLLSEVTCDSVVSYTQALISQLHSTSHYTQDRQAQLLTNNNYYSSLVGTRLLSSPQPELPFSPTTRINSQQWTLPLVPTSIPTSLNYTIALKHRLTENTPSLNVATSFGHGKTPHILKLTTTLELQEAQRCWLDRQSQLVSHGLVSATLPSNYETTPILTYYAQRDPVVIALTQSLLSTDGYLSIRKTPVLEANFDLNCLTPGLVQPSFGYSYSQHSLTSLNTFELNDEVPRQITFKITTVNQGLTMGYGQPLINAVTINHAAFSADSVRSHQQPIQVTPQLEIKPAQALAFNSEVQPATIQDLKTNGVWSSYSQRPLAATLTYKRPTVRQQSFALGASIVLEQSHLQSLTYAVLVPRAWTEQLAAYATYSISHRLYAMQYANLTYNQQHLHADSVLLRLSSLPATLTAMPNLGLTAVSSLQTPRPLVQPAAKAFIQDTRHLQLTQTYWIKDQSELTPEAKGAYTLETAAELVANDFDLNLTQLSDGTYLYYYLPVNEYGECVANRYCIDYGFVKGG